MKVITFKLPNGIVARAHVLSHAHFMPQLHDQGLIGENDFIIQVDWQNDGRFRPVFTRKMHLVCPYCGTANDLEAQDLGFEEFECGYCDCTYTVPEDPAELREANLQNMKASTEAPPASHYRIMLMGEDGCESCLENGVPAKYADIVCEGYQSRYTEGQKCWTEPEETLADLRRMCDYDDCNY